jgi:methanogenic corrinoid protein MtbC1
MPDGPKPIVDLDFDDAAAQLVALGSPRALAVELLDYLRPALELGRSDLFESYIAWRAARAATEGDKPALVRAVASLHELASRVGPEWHERWSHLADVALVAVSDSKRSEEVARLEGSPVRDLAGAYFDALLATDRRKAVELALGAVDGGLAIQELYLDVFQPVLAEVGRRWERNQLSVGEEHYCTAVTQAIMAQLYPRLFSGESNGKCLVASSVQGNLHEIGIRMVADLLEIEGWDTHFLGADLPEESVLVALEQHEADALALSVTLSSQLSGAASTIARLRDNDRLARVPVVVGGRAFGNDPDVAISIGADAWAPDAVSAIRVLGDLVRAT